MAKSRSSYAVEAGEIFAAAEQFRYTTKVIQLGFSASKCPNKNFGNVAIPMIAFEAFALELYFKSLFKLEFPNIETPGKHNLWDLYSLLGEKTKNKIKKSYKQIGGDEFFSLYQKARSLDPENFSMAPRTMEDNIRHSKDAFVKLRYYYERDFGGYSATNVVDAARLAAIDLQPKWSKYLINI